MATLRDIRDAILDDMSANGTEMSDMLVYRHEFKETIRRTDRSCKDCDFLHRWEDVKTISVLRVPKF